MIDESRMLNRYKKVVTRTKLYVPPKTIMVAPPLGVLALIASWTHEIRNLNILFYTFAPVVAKCLWILTDLSYKAFPKP